MAFLDRFRRKPDAQPKPPTSPRGSSGRAHTRGFLDYEDVGRDFVHPESHTIYDRMYRTDPDVSSKLNLVINPIRGGSWRVDAHGGEEATDVDTEAAEFTEWWLWEFMRPSLPDHLAEALPVVARSGFAPFEAVWGKAEWRGREVLVPRKLSLRLPRSIHEFHQDLDGDLTKLVQFVPTFEGAPGGMVDLPAQDLVYYRVGAEGDNLEGISLLRSVFKPYTLKDGIERMDAVACEREAVGVPIIYPPAGADKAVLDDLEVRVAAIGSGDQRYLFMPGPHAENLPPEQAQQGWDLRFEGLGAGTGTRDFQASIQGFKESIAVGLLSDFMELGKGGEGARATADVQQNPFYTAVEALAGVVERPLNDSLIERAANLNFPNLEGPPKLAMEEADSTSLAELATALAGLVTAGLLQADHDLEDHIRDVAGLPPADAEVRELRDQQLEEDRALAVEQQKAEAESTRKGAVATEMGAKAGQTQADAAMHKAKNPPKPASAGAKPRTAATFGGDHWKLQPRDPGGDGGGQWLKAGTRPESSWVPIGGFLGGSPPELPDDASPQLRADAVALHGVARHYNGPPLIYRTERANEAYKGKAVWGKGRYYAMDRETAADLQLDPVEAGIDDEPDYREPTESRIPNEQRDRYVEVVAVELPKGLDGDRLRAAVLALGYDGIRVAASPNEGGDQLIAFQGPLAGGGPRHSVADAGAEAETFAGPEARARRPFEELMSLGRVADAVDGARESFEQAVGGEVLAIAEAVATGAVDTAALEDRLTDALLDLYRTGVETVREEAERQVAGSSAFAQTFRDDEGRMRRRARLAVRGILHRVAARLERLALAGRSSQEERRAAAQAEGKAALHAEATANAMPALNEGRADGIDALGDRVRGVRYTSILDKNRCERCAEADDDVLRALDDPIRLAHRPPNRECESIASGTNRCRCMEFAELRAEEPATA